MGKEWERRAPLPLGTRRRFGPAHQLRPARIAHPGVDPGDLVSPVISPLRLGRGENRPGLGTAAEVVERERLQGLPVSPRFGLAPSGLGERLLRLPRDTGTERWRTPRRNPGMSSTGTRSRSSVSRGSRSSSTARAGLATPRRPPPETVPAEDELPVDERRSAPDRTLRTWQWPSGDALQGSFSIVTSIVSAPPQLARNIM